MEESFLVRIDPVYTMLFLNGGFSAFFATNQEAWLYVMNRLVRDSLFLPEYVDLLTISAEGERCEVLHIQSFALEKNRRTYRGMSNDEELVRLLTNAAKNAWNKTREEHSGYNRR